MKKLLTGLLALSVATIASAAPGAPQKIKAAATPASGAHAALGTHVEAVPGKNARLAAPRAAEAQAVTPPCDFTFDTYELAQFSKIDANGDGKAWTCFLSAAVLWGNNDLAADDWLVSVPVNVVKGAKYKITINAKSASANDKQRFELMAGNAATAEAMTTAVIAPTTVAVYDYETFEGEFTAAETGICYFGIHAISDKGGMTFYVKSMSISAAEGGEPVGPGPIEPDPEEPVVAETVFTEDFANGIDGLTIINANDDSNTWIKSTGAICCWTSSATGTDDWAIIPDVALQPGRTYTLSLDAKAMTKTAPETFEVMIGSAPEVEAMTITAIASATIEATTYTAFSGEFTVPADGKYNIGIHCISPTHSFGGLYIANLKITAPELAADRPAKVAGLDFTEAVPGEVTITWDAVTADINGKPLKEGDVTYSVYLVGNTNMTLVKDGIKECTYTYRAVVEGTQKFMQYVVYANTDRGESDGESTKFAPVGTPYTNYAITCEADLDKYILGLDYSGKATAGIYGDDDFDELASQDNDDFYLGFYGQAYGAYGSIFTGKIALDGMKNPTLSFHTYNLGLDASDDLNEIKVTVTDMATGTVTDLPLTVVSETGATDAWNLVQFSLSGFAGKTVMVHLTAVTKAAYYTFIDNIVIGDLADNDLEASYINVPATVKAGEAFDVAVTVKNLGAQAAEAYTVSVYADDALLEKHEGHSLASGATAIFTSRYATKAIDEAPVKFHATVELDGDMVAANNRTPDATVEIVKADLPGVTDLEATNAAGSVTLAWSEPDLDAAPCDPITESFEDGEAFSDQFGEWTFVDVDAQPVGGISTIDMPGIEPGKTTGSFWIWDTNLVYDSLSGARTGKKFLFSLFRYDDKQVDDWAISPDLDGSAQTIVFYAKSYTSTYRERIEMYYSTGSTSPADFILIRAAESVLPYWEEYKIDLPEGARHFAIRSMNAGGYRLSIDDVTYIPAGNANLDLVGYNVYRDGVKLNDEPVEENEFTDESARPGESYNYVVTAIYTKGESGASNNVAVDCKELGIGDAALAAVTVSAGAGSIRVDGAQGSPVAVYGIDGIAAFDGIAGGTLEITVSPGVYLVSVSGKVVKVVVR